MAGRTSSESALCVGEGPTTGAPAPRASCLTEQQEKAVRARRTSVVLSSGAGCGKTHVLTERYLSHLRDDAAEVGQIVAITFTERAAREMRRRIRRAVAAEVQAAADDADAERWARHLRRLETAPITTIHSFCANLLRQHSAEVGLDSQFEVYDEVLAVNLKEEAISDCLHRLLTAQTTIGDDLRALVVCFGWEATRHAVRSLVREVDPARWQSWLKQRPEAIAEHWKRARSELFPRQVAYLCRGHPPVAWCLHLLQTIPCRFPELRRQLRELVEGLPRLADAADPLTELRQLYPKALLGRSGARAWRSSQDHETIKKALADLRGHLRALQNELQADCPNLTEAVTIGQRLLRVAGEAVQAYQRAKQRAHVVDFQDLLVMARDLLKNDTNVCTRLRQRYQHILVDELQDTDPVQMELVQLLCGEALYTGKLFAVGDAKQSIYRFRQADVRLFQSLRNAVPGEGQLPLTLNFRSQPAILHFVNALFQEHLEPFEPLAARRPQANPGPCVEFLLCPQDQVDDGRAAHALEATWIARRIRQMLDGRERLVVADRESARPTLRPVEPRDIVLLFRAMTHVALYEQALQEHGLDYYLVGGRAFFAQQEVYDLLNLLRALENPLDALSLAGTLRSPFCCLSDESLYVLAEHPEGLWAGLHDPQRRRRLEPRQQAAAERASRWLARWQALKDRRPLAELLGRVVTDSGYDAALQFEPLGERKLANLWKMIELAREFDRSGTFGLAEFVRRLSDLARQPPHEEQAATQPEEANVIRLMTIHQAKGLEFPVVIVPDLASRRGSRWKPRAVWDQKLGCVVRPPAGEDPAPFSDLGVRLHDLAEEMEDWQEELRKFYVACTRAEDYLMLSAAVSTPFWPSNPWMLVLGQRFDLSTGGCRANAIPLSEQPRVRVTDERCPPPVWQPPSPSARVGHALPGWDQAAIQPLPVVCHQAAVVPMAMIEKCLLHETALDLTQLPASGPVDDPETDDWSIPPDRLAGGWDVELSAEERSWRFALERWDGRSAVGDELRQFAESDIGREIRQAAVVRCHQEFHVGWPWEVSPDGVRFLLRGIMDVVWQDATGPWGLLSFTSRPPRNGDRWRGHEPGLTLAAWCIRQQTGQLPRRVLLYALTEGVVAEAAGAELDHPGVLARVDALLRRASGVPA